ncbi:MAG: DUF362 domain-containing protein [Anaerolineae bacterium]
MPSVYISRCPDYELAQVRRSVGEALSALGGIERFVHPGQRILLKPNLLLNKAPDTAVNTHPALVQAVAEQVRAAGAQAIIGDSPGGGTGFNPTGLRQLYRISGMVDAAQAAGATLNWDCEAVEVPFAEGELVKRLDVIRVATETDAIINLPKLKTHGLLRYTGAVKNLFGLVPGRIKLGYHTKLQDAERFATMLVDLCLWARPVLTIMDAVVAMEGEGPAAGRPRPLGVLLAGPEPAAIDQAALALIGMDPQSVPTMRVALRRGLCCPQVEELELLGAPLGEVRVTDFYAPQTGMADVVLSPPGWRRWLERQFVASPRATERCTGCGVCAANCPAEAITLRQRRATMDLNTCIRCYCCHELCPQHAIELRRSALARLLSRL